MHCKFKTSLTTILKWHILIKMSWLVSEVESRNIVASAVNNYEFFYIESGAPLVLRGGPSFSLESLGMLIRSLWWNYPWIWVLQVQPCWGDAFLGMIVGSWCPWTWFIFGSGGGLHCPIWCILDWFPWWVVDHVGLWRPRWNHCLSFLSWGLSE